MCRRRVKRYPYAGFIQASLDGALGVPYWILIHVFKSDPNLWHMACTKNPLYKPREHTEAVIMQKRPILVIDNDPSVCELVTAILADVDVEVISAPDGLSGIDMARSAQPAVIFLDMILPELDGASTCQRLKQDPAIGDIPVVGITGSPDLTYTHMAFRAGAEFFLSKPFEAESLLQVVGMAVDAADKLPPRFQAEVPVRCRVGADANRSRELMGTTRNLSLGGLLLLLPQNLVPGTVVHLKLGFPEGPITAKGTVVWEGSQRTAEGRYYYHGIKLLSFAEADGLSQYTHFLSEIAGDSPA